MSLAATYSRPPGAVRTGVEWLEAEIWRRGPGLFMVVSPRHRLLRQHIMPRYLDRFARELDLGTWNGADQRFTFNRVFAAIHFGKRVFLDLDTIIMFSAADLPVDRLNGLHPLAVVKTDDHYPVYFMEHLAARLGLQEGRWYTDPS